MSDQELKEEYAPIETPLGVLCGRSIFYLESMKNDVNTCELEISGFIYEEDEEIPYILQCGGVNVLKQIELDTWLESDTPNFLDTSSFFEVRNSKYLINELGKITGEFHHVVFQTYDWVFVVVCEKYSLKLGN